jgi:2,3-bisphosphoglycerate-independent phosphoglycerate mutase
MKYAIILPDGAADDSPLAELEGRTPLEAARIPHMDWVAEHGVLGRALTVPEGFTSATDVATLCLFGYDPHRYYSGRAPIEAVAKGLQARPDQLIFRCNFVTIADGCMRDFTAGHIPQAEADALIAALDAELGAEGCAFYAGVSYRNLMFASNAADMKLRSQPPHDIPDQPVAGYWPKGEGAERVMAIMQRAERLIAGHPVNQRRKAEGRAPVTNIWLWGQGRPVTLESFASRFGLHGAVITGVDIVRGIGLGMGMKLIPVKGATGYIDTDYAAKGRAAVAAIDEFDVTVVHVEAADEAGHLGHAGEKVTALERIDSEIVGPVLERLRRESAWRILVAPDHPTPVSTKSHSPVPPPFCYAGSDVQAASGRPFTERSAVEAGVFIDPGTELIERFVRG